MTNEERARIRSAACSSSIGIVRATLSIAAAAALVLVFLPSGAASGEQWLQYRTSHDPLNSVGAGLRPPFPPLPSTPNDLELPVLKGKRFHVIKWPTPMVPAGYLYAAIDCPESRGGKDLLYFDTNCDGSLADEVPLEHPCNDFISQFGLVKVLFPGDDGPITYHVEADFYKPRGQKALYMQAAGWYEGTVRIGNERHRLVLVDNNCNGCFDDSSMTPWDSDTIRIGQGDDLEQRYLGKVFSYRGRYFRPEPSPDGAFVKLTALDDVALGKARIPEGILSFSLMGRDGHVAIEGASEVAEVPAGRWNIHDWRMERSDEKGRPWSLVGEIMPEMEAFSVPEGGEVSLAIGEPVSVSMDIYRSGEGLYFNLSLVGRLGESVSLERCDGKTPPPRIRIRNEDASYDRWLSFERG